jgi:hypothetical protein
MATTTGGRLRRPPAQSLSQYPAINHVGRECRLATVALLAAAGCGASATHAPAKPTPTVPAVKLDAYARQACAKLHDAVDKGSNGDPTGANQDEFAAVTDAAQSQVAGLRGIAAPDALDFDKAASDLRAWCYTNTPN